MCRNTNLGRKRKRRNGNEAAALLMVPPSSLSSADLLYLVLYDLTGLQAGKDLTLDQLDPQLPLLIRRCLKVPRLTRQRDDDKLEGIFLFC